MLDKKPESWDSHLKNMLNIQEKQAGGTDLYRSAQQFSESEASLVYTVRPCPNNPPPPANKNPSIIAGSRRNFVALQLNTFHGALVPLSFLRPIPTPESSIIL